MNKKILLLVVGLSTVLVFTWILTNSNRVEEKFLDSAKVSIREVGNQLLLSNMDSTSLVLPIIELNKTTFQLSFQKELTIVPDSLVAIVERTFKKSSFPTFYLVEVIQCKDNEVAYSYEMKRREESSIVPCKGRILPKSCYVIKVLFTKNTSYFNKNPIVYFTGFLVLFFVQFFYFRRNTKPKNINKSEKELVLKPSFISLGSFKFYPEQNKLVKEAVEISLSEKELVLKPSFISLGSFKFYPEQNKLVKEAVEISLSKKECELLEIFISNPNKIIKREELTKKVWEDHGVIVGRSLDTYISKLRKKLKNDENIKLTNVHGVGYKLEVN